MLGNLSSRQGPARGAAALARELGCRGFSGPKGRLPALQTAGPITISPVQEAAREAAGIRRIPFPEPANKSLAMRRKSLISAIPSPAREHRAALFPDGRIAWLRLEPRSVCSGASRRFGPQRLRHRLQGEALSFGIHMSLMSPSDLGLHRLLWKHSGESSSGFGRSTQRNAEAVMFL